MSHSVKPERQHTTMTTTPVVIRDSIYPLIVATKFDHDHEYDTQGDRAVVTHVDITAKVLLSHGDSAIALDFGVFGDVAAEYLAEEYDAQITALTRLQNTLSSTLDYLKGEYRAALGA